MILDYIESVVARRGDPPSVREIADAVGLKSPASVHRHLRELHQSGQLKHDSGFGYAPARTGTLDLSGTERMDGYDRTQQLSRRMERWLDDLVLLGSLSPEERRDIHLSIGPGTWQWAPDPAP